MQNFLLAFSIFTMFLSYKVQACSSNQNCDSPQICCWANGWTEAQNCGGHFLCGIGNGGNCCVDPDSSCANPCIIKDASKEKDRMSKPKSKQ